MTIEVRLFAAVRQAAGEDSLQWEFPVGSKISDLRARLRASFPQAAPAILASWFAVGTAMVGDDAPLIDGAVVACIPPVSGG